ncbi:MAG TPA: LysR substrate-binding domain-containing protein [Terriglobales bacterium]|jgi:LysR family transcriptional regulator for metE and metH|nr:LysR substrate-binding domain-containing protein [Terriglobales bacterium]
MDDVRLEIRHLKLLDAVAGEGSITGAGRRLHLTQSALSHQLRDAEEKLGTALFLRLGKKMVPTPAGEQLVVCARKVLEDLRNAETRIDGLNGGTRGMIRLSTECYTCYHWLPPLLKKFHGKFPHVDVSIDAGATSQPADALLQGKLDLAIMNSPPRNRSLCVTPMFEDEVMLVMSPGHPLASSEYIRPRDLADETVMIYPPRQESTLLMKVLAPAGVVPKRVLEIPLTEAIIEMAATGTGIGFLDRWAIAPDVERGRIVARPLSSRGFRRRWWMVTLRNQPAPPYLAEFLSLLTNFSPKQARRLRAG